MIAFYNHPVRGNNCDLSASQFKNSEVSTEKFRIRSIVTNLQVTNEPTTSNSTDDEWANLAVAHGAGDLVGYHQTGGHPAGEHRPHHVHDADRDPPRHRHPCSLSSAAPEEAIPQTPFLESANIVEPRRRLHEFR